jgi:hypothetical protein
VPPVPCATPEVTQTPNTTASAIALQAIPHLHENVMSKSPQHITRYQRFAPRACTITRLHNSVPKPIHNNFS